MGFIYAFPLRGRCRVYEADEVENRLVTANYTSSTASGPPSPQGEGLLDKQEFKTIIFSLTKCTVCDKLYKPHIVGFFKLRLFWCTPSVARLNISR